MNDLYHEETCLVLWYQVLFKFFVPKLSKHCSPDKWHDNVVSFAVKKDVICRANRRMIRLLQELELDVKLARVSLLLFIHLV